MLFSRRLALGFAAWVASAALCASVLSAQSSTTGAIRGRVSTPEGQPVAGAQIVARNTTTGSQRGVISDADGRYVVPLLQPGGPYTDHVRWSGYQAGWQ